jgi:uncharacterized membrane protein
MLEFYLSLLAFLTSHMLVSRTRLRPWLVARMGMWKYLAAYSVFSIGMLWWLIDAARRAPRVTLWPWDAALYWFPNILMPLAFILLVSGFVVANPLSIAPRAHGFNPDRPGLVVAMTRHPVLWGFFLWSASHLVVNGEYPLALMFFVFLLFSVAGLFILDRKRRREMGAEAWRVAAARTSAILFLSPALRGGQFSLTRRDIAAIIGGLLLYAVFYALHVVFFGINPAPPL